MLRASHWEEGVCYTGPVYRKKIALSMLAQAHRIFTPTSRIRHLARISGALNARTGRERSAAHRFFSTLDPAVVDAFRITSCFENLFKARLILRGYLIHQIDKGVQPGLWKQQRERPIRVSTLKRAEGHVNKRDIGYEFQSLADKTPSSKTSRKRTSAGSGGSSCISSTMPAITEAR